jgi:Flp pilus assembly protein TadG
MIHPASVILPARSPGGNAPAAHGQVLIELVMIISVIVLIGMLGADIGIVSLASSINDSACRDAARAAAQGSNSTTALALAQAAIKAHTADGYYVTVPTINTSQFIYQDFNGSPPANTSPYVSVTTSSTVRIPAPLFFYGARFEPNGSLTFTRTYTFPIVKTQLYLQ